MAQHRWSRPQRSAGGSFLRLSYAELIAAPERCGEGFDLVVANFALLEEEIGPLLAALHRIMTRGRPAPGPDPASARRRPAL